MLAAALRKGAEMTAMLDPRAPRKNGPVSPTKPPPGAGSGTKKRRTSVLAVPVATKRRRRATAVGRPCRKKVRFAELTVARVPSGALAGMPHPAEQILASGATAGAEADELRCAVIRFCLASALHPGDSSGAFGQRCVPPAAIYLDMIASPTSYEACYADMSLVSVLTHALADAFLSFSEETARRCARATFSRCFIFPARPPLASLSSLTHARPWACLFAGRRRSPHRRIRCARTSCEGSRLAGFCSVSLDHRPC